MYFEECTFVKHIESHNDYTNTKPVKKRSLVNTNSDNENESQAIEILDQQNEMPVDIQVLNHTINDFDDSMNIHEKGKNIESPCENKENNEEENVSKAADIVSYLHAIVFVPMKTLSSIILAFQNFHINNFVDKLLILSREKCTDNSIINTLNIMTNVFQNYKTTHKTLKALKNLHYVEPKIVHVATVLHSKRVSKIKRQYKQMKLTVVMIQLSAILKKFLGLTNVFIVIRNYIEKMKKCECMCSIYKSDRWREMEKNSMEKSYFL